MLFIKSGRKLKFEKCVLCGEFLETPQLKIVLNFTRLYTEGKDIPSEDILVTVEAFGDNLSYKVSYTGHKDFYDFQSPEDLIDKFLADIKNKFVPPDRKVVMECSFTLINFQFAPAEFNIPISLNRSQSTFCSLLM